ncbi:MAG: hypothetical protein EOO24_34365, partial [Comamonadaceae bacterium]
MHARTRRQAIAQCARPTSIDFHSVAAIATTTAATIGGVILCFSPVDPVRELFWAAVINGVLAVPLMVVM